VPSADKWSASLPVTPRRPDRPATQLVGPSDRGHSARTAAPPGVPRGHAEPRAGEQPVNWRMLKSGMGNGNFVAKKAF
jgi:hypothetical protein